MATRDTATGLRNRDHDCCRNMGRSRRLGAPLCLASRMESDTVRLTYRGGVRGVSMLTQMLEEQGVSVQYATPRETRDMTEAPALSWWFYQRPETSTT
jgi:hypothetical protein